MLHRGHIAERGQFFEAAQIILRHLECLGGRQRKFGSLRRGLKIGAGLFQQTRGCFIGDGGE